MAIAYPQVTPAPLSQVFPQSQSDWQQMLNQLFSWQQILSGASIKWQPITLLNGWTGTASYYQDLTRRVWCRGLITTGTKVDGTQLFTLPYGPAVSSNLTAYAYSGSAVAQVGLTVMTTGVVAIFGASAYTGSYAVSLDNLSYSTVV